MTELDPGDEITAAENALRELIQTTLSPDDSEGWFAGSGLTEARLQRVEERRSEDAARRRGVVPEVRPLYFTDLTDLKTIIDKNWERFKPCLEDKRLFDLYMDRLVALRTAQMHGRALLVFERALAAGISGEIRNRITLYRSGMGATQEFFSRIEYVRDSFGRVRFGHGSSFEKLADITVRPGDTVTFDLHAWAPDDAMHSWLLIFSSPGKSIDFDEDTFVWTVAADDIRETQELSFYLRSQREYQRAGTYDDAATLSYRVLPRLATGSRHSAGS